VACAVLPDDTDVIEVPELDDWDVDELEVLGASADVAEVAAETS
jgi:hypothetical protein